MYEEYAFKSASSYSPQSAGEAPCVRDWVNSGVSEWVPHMGLYGNIGMSRDLLMHVPKHTYQTADPVITRLFIMRLCATANVSSYVVAKHKYSEAWWGANYFHSYFLH